MEYKTFIEAQRLRDDIIKALGDDETYYKGEASYSLDMTETSSDSIKKEFKRYDVRYISHNSNFSPNMKKNG